MERKLVNKMNYNLYVGFDPSYTAFGISYIDELNKKLVFNQISRTIDKHSTRDKFQAITDLVYNAKDYLEDVMTNDAYHWTYIGEEVTTVYTGYFAPELYALDYKLFTEFEYDYADISIYSPSTITKVTGHKSSKKEETIYLIEDQILPVFIKHGYSIEKLVEADTKTDVKIKNKWVRRRTMTDGSADSFIYCLLQFLDHTEDLELKNELIDLFPKFLEAKALT